MVLLPVEKLINDDMTVKNAVFVHSETYSKLTQSQYYELKIGKVIRYTCIVLINNSVKPNCCAISKVQRDWYNVVVGDTVDLKPINIDMKYCCISRIVVELGFFTKKDRFDGELDTEIIGNDFLKKFENFPFQLNQSVVYSYLEKKFRATIIQINLIDYNKLVELTNDTKLNNSNSKNSTCNFGILIKNSQIIFQKATGTEILLKGSSKQINMESRQLLDPNWDFSQIGVGGLDHEFNIIFRRAFSSRIFPPEIVEELGLKHVRGILLYGPPGTGKTLLARQIGKMLNSREPKIINGPEILNKFVGESEANIRKLFEDAEEEQRLKGVHSCLHLIIFDEIDAICKQRGQSNRGTAVHDTVVNQLLSKIDGVHQLNNILIIGMTNRKDLIDSALLRPGRFEIQLEIGLPNKDGRVQILSIHTDRLKKFNKLDPNVDLNEIAETTKNFSGAELEGLVRAATTTAMNRLVKLENGKVSATGTENNYDNFKLFQDDFLHALKYDIKPAFGVNLDDEAHLHKYLSNGIILWSDRVENTVEKLNLMIDQTRNGHLISPVSVLIEGDDGAGKTALAIDLALKSKFPLIKLCTPDDMLGMNEFDKCNYITKLFNDLSKSDLACIVIDNIERIVDYVAIGPRFSNSVLQTLFVLIKQKTESTKKLLIACTTSSLRVLEAMEFSKIFTTIVHVPNITTNEHMRFVLEYYNLFNTSEMDHIISGLKGIDFSIKNLLSLSEIAIQLSDRDQAVNKVIELLNDEYCYKSYPKNLSII